VQTAKVATYCHIKIYKVGTLSVDGWVVTFGTARRGLSGAVARPGPSSPYLYFHWAEGPRS